MSEEVRERDKFPAGTLTQPGGTMTSEGFIPHCLKGGVAMPVALVMPVSKMVMRCNSPAANELFREWRLVATPQASSPGRARSCWRR